jgi:hypothetical protein
MAFFKYLLQQWIVAPKIWQLLSNLKSILKSVFLKHRQILKQNIALKDIHTGSRCFILGAGSSVKSQDIKKLANEYVISVSNTFVHPDFGLIKPKYHVLPPIMHAHGQLGTEEKFVSWLREMEVATGDAEMFFHIGDKHMIEKNKLFDGRTVHWIDYGFWNGDYNRPLRLNDIPEVWSVSETAITIALYLGFKEIYLLGIDHDWFNGLFVYFYDHKTQHAVKPDEKTIPYVDAEFQMRRHADIFKKYKYLYSIKNNIYNANANPEHYMDVFPKISYESLFINTNHQPADNKS